MAEGERVADVAEGDLHIDPVLAQLAGIADQGAHVAAFGEQNGQELSADHAGCSREQDHRADCSHPYAAPARARLRARSGPLT